MRKDDPNAVNTTSSNRLTTPHNTNQRQQSHIEPRVSSDVPLAPCSSPAGLWQIRSLPRLQFFVRMMSEGKTLVLHANSEDTVKSIHERIQEITGIPAIEQRLIYGGKQLQWEQSLSECSIQNDAGLQLVGRMRSTHHPHAWQVIDEMVSLIRGLCKGDVTRSSKFVKTTLMEFLKMTPKNDNEAASHLEIFLSSYAPAALVMLYMSPRDGNKECADESVRQFVTSIPNVLPKHIHPLCAPIVLEFCKLLGKAPHDDPLYSSCRSSLGLMIQNMCIEWGSKDSVSTNKSLIIVEDIFPFVRELAVRLSNDLVSSMESTRSVGPLSTDIVCDFASFLLPIRTAIMGRSDFGGSISMPFCEGSYNNHGDEIKFLYGIYADLIGKVEQCLQKMEECLAVKEEKAREGEHSNLGFYEYLAILKELNSISVLYRGAEEQFWTKLRHRKVSLCYLILKYAKRSDNYRWLLEHKDVIDFESRRHLVMMMLPQIKNEYDEIHEMLIDRSQLLAESFEDIVHADPKSLRCGLFMEFKHEEATGPGVLREWFFLVCQAIFNPQNALFVACPNDRRRFFPNPVSKVDPLHLEYFSFAGRVIALALMHKVQVGIVLDRVFFLQLAGKNVSLEDIRDADPCLFNSCKKILEMDADMVDSDALGLTFELEVEELGSRKIVELCPGGKNTAVNSQNRNDYVKLLIQHRFVTFVTEQRRNFARGFADILCDSKLQELFFQSLELEDLDWMLYGSESLISVKDWKAHTEYNGYKVTDPQILWFWKIVEEMSAEQRKVLLFFWTSVKCLPVEGFGGLASRLYIKKSSESFGRLPSSHTCFYQLCFPPYPSMAVMQERLQVITQEHVGCSFGTW